MTRRWTFQRQLNKLEKKHRGAAAAVGDVLAEIEANGVPEKAIRFGGLDGAPVFLLRIRIGRHGTRSSRLVFHYRDGSVTPLFVYSKNEMEMVARDEITAALRAVGLIEK